MTDRTTLNRCIINQLRWYRRHTPEGLKRPRPLSQRELGELVGVSRTTIANIENEKQFLSIDLLYRICVALGLEIQDVLPTVAEFEAGIIEDAESVPGATFVEVGGVEHDMPAEWASKVHEAVSDREGDHA